MKLVLSGRATLYARAPLTASIPLTISAPVSPLAESGGSDAYGKKGM